MAKRQKIMNLRYAPKPGRLCATEVLACGHDGKRGHPRRIRTSIALGHQRLCVQCSLPRVKELD